MQSNIPILFILVGLPFSGKSTLLKNLTEYKPIVPLSFDTFWVELEKRLPQGEKIKLTYESVTELLDKKIGSLLNEGKSVIYDSLNDTVDQRDRLRKIAADHKVNSLVLYLNTPLSIIAKRREKNIETLERHQVNDEKFDQAKAKFVAPLTSEEAIEFLPNMTIEELWKMIEMRFK